MVIKLLLLVVIAGNIAFVAVNGDSLVDVEAVSEWRIDKDAVDEDLDLEPGLLALYGFPRESTIFVVGPDTLAHHRHSFGSVQLSTRTTRAPPFAEQA